MSISALKSQIQRVEVKGVETRYFDDQQDADPVLLIHGGHFGFFIPLSLESWGETIRDLSKYGRVIAVDKLGQGETALPLTDEDWTVNGVAEHVVNFIETLDLRNLSLVGHSRGGLTAMLVAFRIPSRVKKLVVVSSASTAPAPTTGTDMDFYNNVERTAPPDGAGLVRHYHAAQAVAEGPLPEDYVDFAGQMVESDRQQAAVVGYNRNAAAHWLPSLTAVRDDLQGRFRETGIPVPTLVIWGVNDRSAPVTSGHALFGQITQKTKNSSMHLLNNAGHQVFRDQRELFTAVVGAFIEL